MSSIDDNDRWYVIRNLDNFINYTRKLVFESYGKTSDSENIESDIDSLISLNEKDQKELDTILSFQEAETIIKTMLKKQKHKRTKKIRLLLNDDLYLSIVDSLGNRMTSNILHGLVQKGVIESGFDEESNDFIFWIKE